MSNIRFEPLPDQASADRRLLAFHPERKHGILKWGTLSLPVVQISDTEYVTQELTPQWKFIASAEGITLKEMDRWQGLPEGQEQLTQPFETFTREGSFLRHREFPPR